MKKKEVSQVFQLADGRQNVYQWDINVKLLLDESNESADEVHFSARFSRVSLSVEVVHTVDSSYVTIPNILLQKPNDIIAYSYITNADGSYTKYDVIIPVIARPKPSGYIYEETETLTWKSLDDKINDLGESTANSVKYTAQELTDEQKTQARTNIGAVSVNEVPKQAQADWLQNDNAASDFVKNRTHWLVKSKKLLSMYIQDSADTEVYLVEGYSYYLKTRTNSGGYYSYSATFNSNFSKLGSSDAVTLILLEDYKGNGTYKCRITVHNSAHKQIEFWRAEQYFELNNNYIPKPSDDGTLRGGIKAFNIDSRDNINDFEYIYHSNNGIAYTRSDIVYRDSFYLTRTDFFSYSKLNAGLAETYKKIICAASGESSAYFPDLNNSSYPIEITTLKNKKFILDTADGKKYISTYDLNGDEVVVTSSQETTLFMSLKEEETLLKSGFISGTSTYDSIGLVEGKSYSFEIYSTFTDAIVEYLELTAVYSESLGMVACFSDGNSTNTNANRFWVCDTKSYINPSWVSNALQSLKAVYGKQLVPSIPKEAIIGFNDIILTSSTEGSNKRFRITVDDSGTLSATEVTQ